MTMTTREQYVDELKVQLDRCNATITRCEAQANTARADAKKRLEEHLQAAREQREKALHKLRLLESAAGHH